MYIHIYIYMYMYIYVCVCVCVYIERSWHNREIDPVAYIFENPNNKTHSTGSMATVIVTSF